MFSDEKVQKVPHLGLIFKVLLFVILIYYPFFLHLTSLPIYIYDEARVAVNAYEMYANKNYIVAHFGGLPDLYNTKPPLLLWLQVLGFKLFGVGELAVRLPSAVAAALTAVTVLGFSIRYLKSYWLGMIAVAVLVSSSGYVCEHVSRTGDYDALLTLFTTAYCFSYFAFLETQKNKYLHLFFVLLLLVIFTKSIQGLMILPALLLFALWQKQLLFVLKNKWVYINALLLIPIIATFFLLREHYNAGYLKAVWENDLGGRFTDALDDHRQVFNWYYANLIWRYFKAWWWLVPISLVLGFWQSDERTKKITVYLALIIAVYSLVISSAQTKLEWYDAPLFPFLSLLVAIGIHRFISIFTNIKILGLSPIFKQTLAVLLFIAWFVLPYKSILTTIYTNKIYDWQEPSFAMPFYLKAALEKGESLDKRAICYDEYTAVLQFYVGVARERKQIITFKKSDSLATHDVVITSQAHIQKNIERLYTVQTATYPHGVNIYTIQAVK